MFITDQSVFSVADLSPAFQREFMLLMLQYDHLGPALLYALGA
jgi:hypothetical protein